MEKSQPRRGSGQSPQAPSPKLRALRTELRRLARRSPRTIWNHVTLTPDGQLGLEQGILIRCLEARLGRGLDRCRQHAGEKAPGTSRVLTALVVWRWQSITKRVAVKVWKPSRDGSRVHITLNARSVPGTAGREVEALLRRKQAFEKWREQGCPETPPEYLREAIDQLREYCLTDAVVIMMYEAGRTYAEIGKVLTESRLWPPKAKYRGRLRKRLHDLRKAVPHLFTRRPPRGGYKSRRRLT